VVMAAPERSLIALAIIALSLPVYWWRSHVRTASS